MNQDIKVKFCGMKTLKDLETCRMADYIGFIVGVPKSKRNLSISAVKSLIDKLPQNKKSVIVITDLTLIEPISSEIHPYIIQVHTKIDDLDSLLDLFEKLDQKYALTMGSSEHELLNGEILDHEISAKAEYIIIDSIAGKEISGGKGKPRNFQKTSEIISKYSDLHFLIAGGLKPSNIVEILQETHPYGVDVSSGIENYEGTKDKELVTEFINKIQSFNGEYINA